MVAARINKPLALLCSALPFAAWNRGCFQMGYKRGGFLRSGRGNRSSQKRKSYNRVCSLLPHTHTHTHTHTRVFKVKVIFCVKNEDLHRM
jgi:hypothetical protein